MLQGVFDASVRGIVVGRRSSQGVASRKSNQRGEKQRGSQQCVCLQGLRAATRKRMMKKPRVLKRKMLLLIHEPGHYRLTPVSAGTCLKLAQLPNPLATSPQHFICSHFSGAPRRRAQVNLPSCLGLAWEPPLLEATAAEGRPLLLRWKRNERAQWTSRQFMRKEWVGGLQDGVS